MLYLIAIHFLGLLLPIPSIPIITITIRGHEKCRGRQPHGEMHTPAKCLNVILTPIWTFDFLSCGRIDKIQGRRRQPTPTLRGQIQLLSFYLSNSWSMNLLNCWKQEAQSIISWWKKKVWQGTFKDWWSSHSSTLFFTKKNFFSVKSVLTCLLLLKLFHSFLKCEGG